MIDKIAETFGQSYTSLILGITVVIISTALLLSFVHERDKEPKQATVTNETVIVIKDKVYSCTEKK